MDLVRVPVALARAVEGNRPPLTLLDHAASGRRGHLARADPVPAVIVGDLPLAGAPVMSQILFVTCPKGAETLLRDELRQLGADPRPGTGGVTCEGDLELAYRICLWSRIANRVLLGLARFGAPSPEVLYTRVSRIDWSQHLAPEGSLAVDCFVKSSQITHSHYAALKVKDAVVDQFRLRFGVRPSVDLVRPDLRLNLYLYRDEARLALDISGDSLHRRGYRGETGAAPLKENLAAAILMLAGWPSIAAQGGPLWDPLCGSGTLPIEGALMAAGVAPGYWRRQAGCAGWRGHDPALWERLRQEVEAQPAQVDWRQLPPLLGEDRDPQAIRRAQDNARQANLAQRIQWRTAPLGGGTPPQGSAPGLLMVNPPYGERLGAGDDLADLYRRLGDVLRDHCLGWRAALFTGNPALARALRLRPEAEYELYNGPLECRLLVYQVAPDRLVTPRGKGTAGPTEAGDPAEQDIKALAPDSSGARMLVNRLHKNLKHLGRWARRNQVSCYRLYDSDLPEYAVALDLYQSGQTWAVLQEYQAPLEIDPTLARRRLGEALGAVAEVLELPPERLVLKQRRRQRGSAQYQKLGTDGEFHVVEEGGCKLLVNFADYLDTGLFLDHRQTRSLIRQLAPGRDFLNLFAYTGAATVQAAAGGATSTTSLDLSNTYLDWAEENLVLNGFGGSAHRLIQADCLDWLADQAQAPERRYGLIFLDPPTFSTSKRMEGTLDIQRDHPDLIRWAAQLLTDDGILLFSNNYRRFRLEESAWPDLRVEDISAATLPEDFRRNPRIHRCWRISRRRPE